MTAHPSPHPARRRPRPAPAVALVGTELAAVLLLVRLGEVAAYRVDWTDLGAWLATAHPVEAAIGLLRPIALALAVHLCVATVLHLAALVAGVPVAVRGVVAAVTPAAVRRVTERAVAVTFVATSWAPAAAGAAELPPGLRVPSAVRTAPAVEVATETVLEPDTEAPSGVSTELHGSAPVVAPARPPARPVAATDLAGGAGAPATATVVVRPGEHLWGIAARHLADLRGTTVADLPLPELARYWREVVDRNRPHLRSGDADLIHPGEEVRLPPA